MPLRRPATARLAVVAIALAVVAGLLGPTTAGAAPAPSATSARAAEPKPTYGPWSSYFYDVRVRVATPTKKQRRAYVQVNRNNNDSGDRQFKLTWRPAGDSKVHSTLTKLVRPGGTITFYTAWLPCGTTRLTLMGRGRASSDAAYGAWKSFGANIRRAC